MARRKSLVAAANGPFQGPWIYLEAGEWIIELPASGGFAVQTMITARDGSFADSESVGMSTVMVTGPARARVIIPEKVKNIFVHATQLSRA